MMLNSGGSTPKNKAEKQATEDAWEAENNNATQMVVVYAPQDSGLWLVEPYGDGGDEYEVTLPQFTWNQNEHRKLGDAAKEYVARAFPTLGQATMRFKTFEASPYPGVVYVVWLDVPSEFDKSQKFKIGHDDTLTLRWFDLKDTKKLGEAAMSREYEWQADLLKMLR